MKKLLIVQRIKYVTKNIQFIPLKQSDLHYSILKAKVCEKGRGLRTNVYFSKI